MQEGKHNIKGREANMETITLTGKAKEEMAKIRAKATIDMVRAVADTIKEAGRIPAGTLYASLMTQGCTIQQYEQIEGLLVRSGLVRKVNDELIWIG